MHTSSSPEPERALRHATPIGLALVATAIFAFLPELLLVNLELWSTIALATWAFGGLLGGTVMAFAVPGAILVLLGIWFSALTVGLVMRNYAPADDTN